MYGRFTIPAWNFIEFNVLSSGSANFGVNPFYYYLTEGIPPVLTLATLPLVLLLWEKLQDLFRDKKRPRSVEEQRNTPKTDVLLYVAVFYVVFHSFIAHKEHRFLLPVLPLIMPYIAGYICRMKRYGAVMFWAIVVLQVGFKN
jgi:hypothetical protein